MNCFVCNKRVGGTHLVFPATMLPIHPLCYVTNYKKGKKRAPATLREIKIAQR